MEEIVVNSYKVERIMIKTERKDKCVKEKRKAPNEERQMREE